jgi:hypothetical protein
MFLDFAETYPAPFHKNPLGNLFAEELCCRSLRAAVLFHGSNFISLIVRRSSRFSRSLIGEGRTSSAIRAKTPVTNSFSTIGHGQTICIYLPTL